MMRQPVDVEHALQLKKSGWKWKNIAVVLGELSRERRPFNTQSVMNAVYRHLKKEKEKTKNRLTITHTPV